MDGVNAIYEKKPKYKLGCDGWGEYCDCIGMGRGGLERAGVTDIKHMGGTNNFARFCAVNLRKIKSVSELKVGDVLLKVRDKDDKDYPLPDSYRVGGVNYTGDLNNYTHYGTVTKINPLEITHMTSPTAKKDTKLGNWTYVCDLPYVDYSGETEGGETPMNEERIVHSSNGGSVNMRSKPSTSGSLIVRVPNGSHVEVIGESGEWCNIKYNGKTGWMMSKYLLVDDATGIDPYVVLVSRDELEEIYNKIGNMLGLRG